MAATKNLYFEKGKYKSSPFENKLTKTIIQV
jgi:hypothetical protein